MGADGCAVHLVAFSELNKGTIDLGIRGLRTLPVDLVDVNPFPDLARREDLATCHASAILAGLEL
jgi:hypothetical protein